MATNQRRSSGLWAGVALVVAIVAVIAASSMRHRDETSGYRDMQRVLLAQLLRSEPRFITSHSIARLDLDASKRGATVAGSYRTSIMRPDQQPIGYEMHVSYDPAHDLYRVDCFVTLNDVPYGKPLPSCRGGSATGQSQ